MKRSASVTKKNDFLLLHVFMCLFLMPFSRVPSFFVSLLFGFIQFSSLHSYTKGGRPQLCLFWFTSTVHTLSLSLLFASSLVCVCVCEPVSPSPARFLQLNHQCTAFFKASFFISLLLFFLSLSCFFFQHSFQPTNRSFFFCWSFFSFLFPTVPLIFCWFPRYHFTHTRVCFSSPACSFTSSSSHLLLCVRVCVCVWVCAY